VRKPLPIAMILLSGLLALAGGCTRLETRDRAVKLEDATRTYQKAVRWGEYEIALHMVGGGSAGTPPPPEPDLRFLRHIRVTSYEVTSQVLSSDESEAAVTAEIDFYHTDTLRLRHLTDHQLWRYDEQHEGWHLASGLPDFKQALR
jgi:hypothetical protein